MKLYVVMTKKQIGTNECDPLFESACARLGVDYERIIADEISLEDIQTMQFTDNSLLYRMGTTTRARTVESMMLLFHTGKFTTIHEAMQPKSWGQPLSETAAQLAAGLNIIPTMFLDESWTTLSSSDVAKKLQPLGGLPVVVKTLGKSHGQGVQKADDAEELQKILKEVDFTACDTIARTYLADYRHYRLIVIDGAVEAVIEYHKPEDDFRTNASTPVVSAVDPRDLPSGVIELAVEATKLRGSIVAGVDILVDKTDGVGYLAEVNVPCYFARAAAPTGVDIAGKIIEAMQRKQMQESK